MNHNNYCKITKMVIKQRLTKRKALMLYCRALTVASAVLQNWLGYIFFTREILIASTRGVNLHYMNRIYQNVKCH